MCKSALFFSEEEAKGLKRHLFSLKNWFRVCIFRVFCFPTTDFCSAGKKRAQNQRALTTQHRRKREKKRITTRRGSMNDHNDVIVDDIRVPIGDSGEHVSIDPHNLPQKVEDVLGVLQSELAPLRAWLECAKAYLAEDNEEAFLEIVGSGCSPGTKREFFVEIVVRCFLLFRLCLCSCSSLARDQIENAGVFFSRIEFCADVNSLSLSLLEQKPTRLRVHENRD